MIIKRAAAVVRSLLRPFGGLLRLRPETEASLAQDPFLQFSSWFEASRSWSGQLLPEAACLSTVGLDGKPEGRMVLLKSADPAGFVFYTNRLSAKGRALERHPWAALTFHWERLGRQVRVVGRARQVEDPEADAYFASRPRGSQLAAWASPQSEPVADRKVLLDGLEERRREFEGRPVPRPPHWTGFRVEPDTVEFWQLRPSRLHDRFVYARSGEGWTIRRLAP